MLENNQVIKMMNIWTATTGKINGIGHMKQTMTTTVQTSKLPIAVLKYYHISLVLKSSYFAKITQNSKRFNKLPSVRNFFGQSLSILLHLFAFVPDSLICGWI